MWNLHNFKEIWKVKVSLLSLILFTAGQEDLTDLEFLAGTQNDQDVNVLEGLLSPQDENNSNADNEDTNSLENLLNSQNGQNANDDGDLNALEDLGIIFNFSNIAYII